MKRAVKAIIWTLALGLLGYLMVNQLSENKQTLEENARLTQERNTVIPVVTSLAGKKTVSGNFQVTGSFAPIQQVAVLSEMAGKVTQLYFENGTLVKAGSVLATIDNDLQKIQLETARIGLSKAENDYRRLNKLLGEGGVTQQQLDDAKLAVDNLTSQIKLLEKQISMSIVKAPISGVISNKMVEKGSLISPAFKMADLTNISRLRMQVYLTEEQVVSLKKGDKIGLRADLMPQKQFIGKVAFVDVNAGLSRRFLVEIETDNPGGALKSGMTGTAFFDGNAEKMIFGVPRAAIVGSLQEAKVYVVDNGTARLKQVEAGNIFGDFVQVLGGLSEGDSIVVSGQINLEDGMKIQVAQGQ
jgi:RND family efflux transporter MFP subunit